MRNKPQQLSAYAKKLLREQDALIRNLDEKVNDLGDWNYDMQIKIDTQHSFINKLKSMNLFQLILWWIKK